MPRTARKADHFNIDNISIEVDEPSLTSSNIDPAEKETRREDAYYEIVETDLLENDEWIKEDEHEEDEYEDEYEEDEYEDDVEVDLEVNKRQKISPSTYVARTLHSTRGIVCDLNGKLVTGSIKAVDIANGGLKFLSENHLAVKTLPNGAVTSIPKLMNCQNMKAAKERLQIAVGSQEQPVDLPDIDNTLEYIMDGEKQPGPQIRIEIKLREPAEEEKERSKKLEERLSDLEIAKLLLRRNIDRYRTAPYAYRKNGQVFPEYKEAIVKHTEEVGLTAEQLKSGSVNGYKNIWTGELRARKIQQRIDEIEESYWEIYFRVPHGYDLRLYCPECDIEISRKEGPEHFKLISHKAKKAGNLYNYVKDASNTLQIFQAQGAFKEEHAFRLLQEHYPDEVIVEEIAAELLHFYERLTCRFHENMKMAALALACKRVRDRHASRTTISTPTIHLPPVGYVLPALVCRSDKIGSYVSTDDPNAIYCKMLAFNPDNLTPYRIHTTFASGSVLAAIEVPETPDYIVWTKPQRTNIVKEQAPMNSNDPRLEMAVKLAKYISYKISGKVIRPERARQIVAYYKAFYQSSPIRFECKPLLLTEMLLEDDLYRLNDINLYIVFDRRHKLFVVTPDEKLHITRIRPSSRVRRMVNGALPYVFLHTLDGKFIAQVLDKALETFLHDGDPLQTWLMLCQAADAVNEDAREGSIPNTWCLCTPKNSTFTLHHCPTCFKVETCADMTHPEGKLPMCRRCTFTTELRLDKSRRHITSIFKLLHKESRSLPIEDRQPPRNTMKEIWHRCSRPVLEDGTWKFIDEYTNDCKLVDVESIPGDGRKRNQANLMAWSLDATFPYIEHHNPDGQWSREIHCLENLRATTVGHNYLKYNHLPGLLHLVSVCWSHGHPDAKSTLPVEELHRRIMEQANDMTLVEWQTPTQVTARLKLPFGEKRFTTLSKEWRLCAPLAENHKAYSENRSRSRIEYDRLNPPRAWTGKPLEWEERIEPILLQMEQRWARKLPRQRQNGCPYPFHAASMPGNWNFWQLWTLFTHRVAKMWDQCNGLWPQVDTAETLFLEACVQYLNPAHREWLNLPLTIIPRHPFRFAVAHKTHGQMLRSGWESHRPHDLSQYSEERSNILIEASITNWMKNNASKGECEEAREHLLNISLPESIYCPRELLRPHGKSGPQYAPWSIDNIAIYKG